MLYETAHEILKRGKFNIADLCQISADLRPQEWPEQVILPILSLGKLSKSIFGYHQVAMDRNHKMPIIDALLFTELCESKNEARRKIQSNSVMINRQKVKDFNYVISSVDVLPNIDSIVLECGKYNYGIIEMCD